MTEKKAQEDTKELSTKELKQLAEKDALKRQKNCQQEIEIILRKYQCGLTAKPRFDSEGRTVADVLIASLA